jgi:glycosyltransferase involved in cell wall biosynthesis
MRIVIDMQGAQTASRHRGIGRYTLSFAKSVVLNRGNHEIFLVLSGLFPDTIEPIRAQFEDVLPQENILIWHALPSVNQAKHNNCERRHAAELIREAFIASLQPEVVHMTSLFEGYEDDAVTSVGHLNSSALISACLYDLIPLLNPKQYLESNKFYANYYLQKVEHLKRVDLLLSISEFSRQEAIKFIEAKEDKVINISAAIDEQFIEAALTSNADQDVLTKFKIKPPFLLYTGASDERKNLNRLIHAFSLALRQAPLNYSLVLAGGLPDEHRLQLESAAKKYGLKKPNLIITGFINDHELISLYKLCYVYVFPSWHEGFGLPVLEAMTCGAPVICANTSSLPEVINCIEATFDPFDIDSIRDKMIQVLSDESYRQRLREHGRIESKKFSWDQTAKKAIKAWEDNTFIALDSPPKKIINEKNYVELLPHLSKYITSLNQRDLIITSKCLALNSFKLDQPRQLLVDISELIQRDARTGIQRVVRNILIEWLKEPPQGFLVKPIYAESTGPYRYAENFVKQIMGHDVLNVSIDEPIDYAAGDIFFGLDFQPVIQASHGSFYQHLRNQGVTVRFMLYDLLSINQPKYFPQHADQGFKKWLQVVGESDGAICISDVTANDLKEYMLQVSWKRRRTFKIAVNHLGADMPATKHLDDEKNSTLPLEVIQVIPTFLMVGTLEPRKGHIQVIDAFEQLWIRDVNINLVIVGKQGWMMESLISRLSNHVELNNRLFWLDRVSDQYLERLYAESTCLIAASYGEGFGLPLIEAAKYKLPILARDIPIFREVAGEFAFYFADTDSKGLSKTIRSWLQLYQSSQHPRSDKIPFLTWKQSANQLYKVLGLSSK